jgi:hypothetical protein
MNMPSNCFANEYAFQPLLPIDGFYNFSLIVQFSVLLPVQQQDAELDDKTEVIEPIDWQERLKDHLYVLDNHGCLILDWKEIVRMCHFAYKAKVYVQSVQPVG